MEITIPTCACGERMIVTRAFDIFACMNCDGIQPQELDTKPRKLSKQDHNFINEMRRREKEWYPEQFGGKK